MVPVEMVLEEGAGRAVPIGEGLRAFALGDTAEPRERGSGGGLEGMKQPGGLGDGGHGGGKAGLPGAQGRKAEAASLFSSFAGSLALLQPRLLESDEDRSSDEDAESPRHAVNDNDSDWSMEDCDELKDRELETSAEQVGNGRDMQGINWNMIECSREQYRDTRLRQYHNYHDLEVPTAELERTSNHLPAGERFYEFRLNSRKVVCTVVHFQLRNLVWATSKHDVYVMSDRSVQHWNAVTRRTTTVLDLEAQAELNTLQVSAMCVHKDLLVAGGFGGELVARRLSAPSGQLMCHARATHDEAVTNAVEVFEDGGAARLLTASNDATVRLYDAATFSLMQRFNFNWAVNYASASPDRRLLGVVGDSTAATLVDMRSGAMAATLGGHLDYSFALSWNPTREHMLATGAQDGAARVWDVRHTAAPLHALRGRLGAVRSLRFSPDGQFLAVAEPADYVHVVDVASGFARSEEIDLFGEIAGVSFSPDGEAFFVGVEDVAYGSLLEFSRSRPDRWS